MKNLSILCLATLIGHSVGFSQEQSQAPETSPLPARPGDSTAECWRADRFGVPAGSKQGAALRVYALRVEPVYAQVLFRGLAASIFVMGMNHR